MQQPSTGTWPSILQVSAHVKFYGERLLDPRPASNFQDQVSVFMNLGVSCGPGTGDLGSPSSRNDKKCETVTGNMQIDYKYIYELYTKYYMWEITQDIVGPKLLICI